MDWRERDGVRWLEARLEVATAAFSTRVGGTSEPPFESLNVGMLTGDHPDAVRDNRRRLAAALDRDPAGVLVGHQVHGPSVARREQQPRPNPYLGATPGPARSDGQVTRNPALTPMVQVADCLPVALAGGGGVGMIHCGWRGLAAGIVQRGVAEVSADAAAIGPGIGRCCYEVGADVLGHFQGLGEGIAEGRMLDLAEVARRLLAEAGLVEVESAGICTKCEPELFYSRRRDGERSGRQAGLVWAHGHG